MLVHVCAALTLLVVRALVGATDGGAALIIWLFCHRGHSAGSSAKCGTYVRSVYERCCMSAAVCALYERTPRRMDPSFATKVTEGRVSFRLELSGVQYPVEMGFCRSFSHVHFTCAWCGDAKVCCVCGAGTRLLRSGYS